MTTLVPFESAKVPAVLQQMFGEAGNDLVGNSAGSGFPVISIKGKVFHIQRGGERTLITKPGEDDPASSLEVVIVRANPKRSKVYYATGFTEGENAKPTCYSNNGEKPEEDSQVKQHSQCVSCPHNQWGSKITESGTKSKSCTDSRRLAIATVQTPGDPMMLRVPAASIKNLEEYGKMLAARGLPPQAVVTKIGFDHSVAYPSLTFKPVAIIGDAEALKAIKTASESEIVGNITGIKVTKPMGEAEANEDVAPAATPPTPVEAAVAAAPAPKTKIKVETAEPVKAAAAPKEVAATGKLEESLKGLIDGLEFDD